MAKRTFVYADQTQYKLKDVHKCWMKTFTISDAKMVHTVHHIEELACPVDSV